MGTGQKITVLDCTLRDGSYAIDYKFTVADTAKICAALEDAGVEYIEIGHGVGFNGSAPVPQEMVVSSKHLFLVEPVAVMQGRASVPAPLKFE